MIRARPRVVLGRSEHTSALADAPIPHDIGRAPGRLSREPESGSDPRLAA